MERNVNLGECELFKESSYNYYNKQNQGSEKDYCAVSRIRFVKQHCRPTAVVFKNISSGSQFIVAKQFKKIYIIYLQMYMFYQLTKVCI